MNTKVKVLLRAFYVVLVSLALHLASGYLLDSCILWCLGAYT